MNIDSKDEIGVANVKGNTEGSCNLGELVKQIAKFLGRHSDQF